MRPARAPPAARRRRRTAPAPPYRASARLPCMAPRSTRMLSMKCSPRNRTQVAPVTGQAMKMNAIGSSASSEVWSQPKRTNLMPHQTNTSAKISTKMCETMRSKRVRARPELRPDVDLEMRALADADHRAEHHHPDEQEARQLLGPDPGRDQRGVARDDLQRDRDDQDRHGRHHQPRQQPMVGVDDFFHAAQNLTRPTTAASAPHLLYQAIT